MTLRIERDVRREEHFVPSHEVESPFAGLNKATWQTRNMELNPEILAPENCEDLEPLS